MSLGARDLQSTLATPFDLPEGPERHLTTSSTSGHYPWHYFSRALDPGGPRATPNTGAFVASKRIDGGRCKNNEKSEKGLAEGARAFAGSAAIPTKRTNYSSAWEIFGDGLDCARDFQVTGAPPQTGEGF